MSRHSWEKVEEDLRRSPLEPRPILYRCRTCLAYRASYDRGNVWRTYYGEPYEWTFTKAHTCEEFTEYRARLARTAAGS